MKYILLSLSLFAFCSFKGNKDHPFKEISEVSEGVFMDRAEVANIHYREYLYWLKKNQSKGEYEKALPSKNIYAAKQAPFKELYFTHQAYNYYPVVGVSYDQAVAYCNWRSERVNEMIAIRKLNKKGKPFNGKRIRYRLPTKVEWELMAKDALTNKDTKYFGKAKLFQGGQYIGRNKKKLKRYNLSEILDAGILETKDYTSPVKSFEPTGDNMYNLIGNVAEIIQEKGIAKGGSYKDVLEDVAIAKDYHYDGPQNWIGFRCVMEVIEIH